MAGFIERIESGRLAEYILFDWNAPLASFGDQTGLEVAQAAFACHQSQVGAKIKDKEGRVFVCEVADGGYYDNAVFGLSGTQVGPDVAGNDLFENVPPRN